MNISLNNIRWIQWGENMKLLYIKHNMAYAIHNLALIISFLNLLVTLGEN